MRRHQKGFTMIELLTAAAVTGILAATAYPSFQAPMLKARRVDGLSALMQLQLQQERWRSDHTAYADTSQLPSARQSSLGYYTLAISRASATGFVATATATGAQTHDAACRVLILTVQDGHSTHTSGPSAESLNSSADNKRCWNQ